MASLLSISTPSATLTFSDIDSDAAAAILHRPTHRRPTTTRTTHHPPTPGTRRFRRHLNALLSADEGGGSSSDYYSATSDGEGREEGEPEVWRSEWRGEFVRVGEEFFEGRVGIARVGRAVGEEEKGSRLQRRVKTIEKERLERRRERRERLERKQRRLAATDQLTTSASSNASSPVMAGSGVEDGSLAGLRAQREGGGARLVQDDFVMVDAEAEVDGKVERAEDGEQPQEEDELMMTNVIAGDALSHDLWRCIDKPTRRLLRDMDDYTYLHHLEHLLLAFKQHTHTHPTTPFHPPPATQHSAVSRFFTAVGSPLAGEVVVRVPDAFLRHLLYGVLAWHVMYSAGRSVAGGRGGGRGGGGGGVGDGGGVVCVRMQRGWVYHEARLERFIQQHYGDRH